MNDFFVCGVYFGCFNYFIENVDVFFIGCLVQFGDCFVYLGLVLFSFEFYEGVYVYLYCINVWLVGCWLSNIVVFVLIVIDFNYFFFVCFDFFLSGEGGLFNYGLNEIFINCVVYVVGCVDCVYYFYDFFFYFVGEGFYIVRVVEWVDDIV